MNIYDIFLVLSVLAGFLMAFNLGANDVANSMASAVGAKAISVRQAVLIAAILNFVGAVFLGSHVTATISKGIINPELINDPKVLMVGMFAALLSAGIWMLAATLTSLPVSSTHSIVGSILGFGFVAGGPEAVQWGKLVGIVGSWIVSPFFGGLLAYIVFTQIRKRILYGRDLYKQTLRWAPFWIMVTVALVVYSFFYKTPLGKDLGWHPAVQFLLAVSLCGMAFFVGRRLVIKLMSPLNANAESVESIFRRMQVGTSCYVALSQGANDVANAIGPVAAIYVIARGQGLVNTAEVPFWMLALGGVGIAVGIAILGYKVMVTVGERITILNNTRGFAVDFGAATTVLVASNMGMPVSTTHAAVGSVVGVGLARGFQAVDLRVLGKIVLYWVITVPVAALTSIVIFQLLRWTIL